MGKAVHAVADGLVFQLNRDSGAGPGGKFIAYIASISAGYCVRRPIAMTAWSKRSARSIARCFEPCRLRRRRLTIADFGLVHILNRQSFQGFSLDRARCRPRDRFMSRQLENHTA
jgi:hypothetical protein